MTEIEQYDLKESDLDKETFPNDGILIPESDYGLAEIYLIDGEYEICEIPMYGGDPRCEIVTGRTAKQVVEEIHSWT